MITRPVLRQGQREMLHEDVGPRDRRMDLLDRTLRYGSITISTSTSTRW